MQVWGRMKIQGLTALLKVTQEAVEIAETGWSKSTAKVPGRTGLGE